MGAEARGILQVTPVLATPTLEEGVHFFRDVLGFTVVNEGGGYAYVERDGAGVRIMDHTITDGAAPGNRRFGIYFDVRDVDAIAAEIRPRLGGRLSHGPADKPYGQREFCIEAPDGNLVVFGQEIG